ncbi:putative NBD/HSP70 family sugar kinase [Microbacterium terrae]|uniref:N-acetylmannosamine kinase n=1 Tax=Microbacterium terrae TaxID=69369 RepID=A0A0M2GZY1_9MICO|nr:ROK family protein [Microbacterium terrae]KJL39505.1 N-acetylmannosamine kinase [Microbacterium terrae]MBP1078097.1 putative NBD/HSP70 family sugar kinase [Microbacterium terrae]GLK00266.1 NagC family transcriptional regulator [Microbacterium terrae]
MKVGLDVGGTKTDAVAVDEAGEIVGRVRLPTGWGPDAVAQTVLDAIAALGSDAGVDLAAMRSVGIGIPGQIVPGTARVTHAVNLGVEDFDLAAALTPALGVPVQVENDVKAAALGAYALHGGTGTVGYLNLGTGVAAGIVADGVVQRGARGTAGEVGHISVDPHGPVCRCGQRGCIEALAGGGSVAERWGRLGALPVRDVFDAADAGDPLARDLRAGIAVGAAAAVRILVLTADVDLVVLGGGVTALGDRLLGDIAAELDASAEASPFMRSLRLRERVELLPTGSPAAAFGAALIGAAPTYETRETVTHG